jgi:hypothetical protein
VHDIGKGLHPKDGGDEEKRTCDEHERHITACSVSRHPCFGI